MGNDLIINGLWFMIIVLRYLEYKPYWAARTFLSPPRFLKDFNLYTKFKTVLRGSILSLKRYYN